MLVQLSIGGLIIAGTVVIHALMIAAATHVFQEAFRSVVNHFTQRYAILLIIGVVLWLLAAHTMEVWLWALCYILTGALPDWPDAIYFALVSVTSLGYGDIVLGPDWRLIAAMSSASGLLLFGWSTGFLAQYLIRLSQAHLEKLNQQSGQSAPVHKSRTGS